MKDLQIYIGIVSFLIVFSILLVIRRKSVVASSLKSCSIRRSINPILLSISYTSDNDNKKKNSENSCGCNLKNSKKKETEESEKKETEESEKKETEDFNQEIKEDFSNDSVTSSIFIVSPVRNKSGNKTEADILSPVMIESPRKKVTNNEEFTNSKVTVKQCLGPWFDGIESYVKDNIRLPYFKRRIYYYRNNIINEKKCESLVNDYIKEESKYSLPEIKNVPTSDNRDYRGRNKKHGSIKSKTCSKDNDISPYIGVPVLGTINSKDHSIMESDSTFNDTPFDPYHLSRPENMNSDFRLRNLKKHFSKKYEKQRIKQLKKKYAFDDADTDPYLNSRTIEKNVENNVLLNDNVETTLPSKKAFDDDILQDPYHLYRINNDYGRDNSEYVQLNISDNSRNTLKEKNAFDDNTLNDPYHLYRVNIDYNRDNKNYVRTNISDNGNTKLNDNSAFDDNEILDPYKLNRR